MGVKEELEELKRKEEIKRAAMKEQALRAAEARIQLEAARQQKTAEQLAHLETRWAAADKTVSIKKAELYARSKEVVTNWGAKRESAMANIKSGDIAHAKKMADAWSASQARYAQWEKETEERRAERERQTAAQRAAAGGRFKGELEARTDRLEAAQAKAEERRLEMQRQKRLQLADRAEQAERKAEEVWQARVRVENALKDRTASYAAEIKKKTEQGDACLSKRMAEIEKARKNNDVWRIPGSLASSSTTLSM